MPKIIDLTGQKFGRLTALEPVGTNSHGNRVWLCKCDCGNMYEVSVDSLRNGRTKSCGCLHSEVTKERNIKRVVHGGRGTRLYRIWRGIKTRCQNENNKDYKHYGGRGIKICNEWNKNFAAFRDWALANGYSDALTIDRIDVNGNYCPENCRWADARTQNGNKSTCFLTYNGETRTRKEWSEITGISVDVIWNRLSNGWSIERALTEPVRGQKKGR